MIGIYTIENTKTNQFYIGSSKDIHQRWENHKYHLQKGTHKNCYLQRSYNKYGIDTFVFKVLCFCNLEELLYHEKMLINKLSPGYNIATEVSRPPSRKGVTLTTETKEKLRNANLGKTPSDKALSQLRNRAELSRKPVKQLDLQGNLIRVWNSVTEFTTETGKSNFPIRECCKQGRYKTAYGYKWTYK